MNTLTHLFSRTTHLFAGIAVGLMLGLGAQAALAWTPAPASPPAGTISAPLTTSLPGQTKEGWLTLNNSATPWSTGLLLANGRLSIGELIDDSDPAVTAEKKALTLNVNGKIGATEYCNADGSVCQSIPIAGGGGGVEVDTLDSVLSRGWTSPSSMKVNEITASLLMDDENTGFFVDPAQTSVLDQLMVSRIVDRENNPAHYLDVDGLSFLSDLTVNGTVQFYRFYDIDNNGYVVDPSGTSRMNTVFVSKMSDQDDSAFGVDFNGDSQFKNIYYTGVAQNNSDRRLKHNIQALPNALNKILQLRGVSFEWNEPENHVPGKQVGVIAQEVEVVYPELVSDDVNGVKSVNYAGMVAPLIEAVKEQQAQIETLEHRISELEARK